jgi:hypothetical protein
VPVFLIYAGIIHAIGLALLLPIVVTLPGPGGEIAPEASAIDVQIILAAPLADKIEADSEQHRRCLLSRRRGGDPGRNARSSGRAGR